MTEGTICYRRLTMNFNFTRVCLFRGPVVILTGEASRTVVRGGNLVAQLAIIVSDWSICTLLRSFLSSFLQVVYLAVDPACELLKMLV